MTRRRWLLVVAACGAAIFALSFVGAWIVLDREVRGEGYRHAVTVLSAWRSHGVPVLTLAVLAALATGAWALVVDRRGKGPAWPLALGSGLTLALLLATAVPVGKDSHATSVDLSLALLLPVGILLAFVMLAASLRVTRQRRAWVAAGVLLGVVVVAAGTGARWLWLQRAEGEGRHWSDGSYTRVATDGEDTETLTIGEGRFTISDRWAGRWEWSGWTVVLDGDPACPDSRGTYHARGVGEEDLRFVMVVDTCADGARGDDLETGTWMRDP